MINKIKNFLLLDIEKILLKNLTRVCFYSIIIIFLFQILYNSKEWLNFITMIWWIIIFWYWYKRYERDKEIEILEKYWKRYDKINSIKNNDKIKFKKILNLCEEEFYLYNKWYISDKLWKKIEHKIEKNLSYLIFYILDTKKEEQRKYISIFLDDNIYTHKKWFWNYIIKKLKEHSKDYKTIWDDIIKKSIYKEEATIKIWKKSEEICTLLINEIKKMIEIQNKFFNN